MAIPKIMLTRLNALGAKIISKSDNAIHFISKKGDDITISYKTQFNGKTLPTWKKKGADGSYTSLWRNSVNNSERTTILSSYGENYQKRESLFKFFDQKAGDKYSGALKEWKTYAIKRPSGEAYTNNYAGTYAARGEYFRTHMRGICAC